MSSDHPLDMNGPEQDREEQLCPNCLAPNPPSLHFCNKCNAPLSAHAAIDPVGSIYAAGYVYQKAASRPRSRTTVIGMWLIFGPAALLLFVFICYAVFVFFRSWFSPSAAKLPAPLRSFSLFTTISIGVLSAAILFKVTRNYLRGRQEETEEEH